MAGLGVATAPAGANVRARTVSATPDFVNKIDTQLCDQHRYCMNGFDGDGGQVNDFPLTPGPAQNLDILQQSNCGGSVTVNPDCPFTPGSDLNAQYKGDTIVVIQLEANKYNFRLTSDGGDLHEASGGDGQLWVIDGLIDDQADLINVDATNKRGGGAVYACADDISGDPVIGSDVLASPTCVWTAAPPGQ